MKSNNLIKSAAFTLVMFFTLTFLTPALAQQPSFDIKKVNTVLSSKYNDVKEVMLWIAVIAIVIGLGMLAAAYAMQAQTAKSGFISLGVGVIIYIVLKAL